MKNFKYLSMILMSLLMCVSFVSCSDKDDEPGNNSSIFGLWTQTNSYGTIIDISFSKDQTGMVKYTYPSGSTSTEYFEYVFTTDSDGYSYLRVISDDCQLVGSYDVVVTPSLLTLEKWVAGEGTVIYQFRRK